MELPDSELVQRLNRETSKIAWTELQKFYARGVVIAVDPALDLIAVAADVHRDNKPRVEQWLSEGQIGQVGDEQAEQWLREERTVWAVVLAPWVLVQQCNNEI